MTKDRLKALIEKKFSQGQVKVAYVNMCYDISGMVKLNQQIQELVKQKGFFKLHAKKEMKAKGYKKAQVVSQPELIEDPQYRTGVMSSK